MIRTGLDVLLARGARELEGARVALLANHTAIDADGRHAIDRLRACGVHLVRLFGPEHGIRATAQDMVGVDSGIDAVSGLPVTSLYGTTEASLYPRAEDLADIDIVVVDLQDVGARYYTYAATMGFMMQTCASLGKSVVVLDRPNPIGGLSVEGAPVQPGFESFVGAFPLPVRHGLTLGEIALWLTRIHGIDVKLGVVACEGWERSLWFEQTGLDWVYPSPNMPTVDTAAIYPGLCLIEATNLSEGRGTTRPFHLVGAPWIDPQRVVGLAERIGADAGLSGVMFRPASFTPGFQKHAGRACQGLEIHLRDRTQLHAYKLGLVVLEAFWRADPAHFAWREAPYEFVTHKPAIDLLTGDSRVSELWAAGAALWPVLAALEPARRAWLAERERVQIYGSSSAPLV